MSKRAAAGLVYLFGDGPMLVESDFKVWVVTQTASTITFGWEPIPGIIGYRFSREGYVKSDGSPRYTVTWSTIPQVKFAKGSEWYLIEAIDVAKSGTYRP